MYIITKFDTTVSFKGDNLLDFLYGKFEIKVEKGQIYIRPKNYQVYTNKDFRVMPISYDQKGYTKKEIMQHFADNYFIDYIKKYDYQTYKVEE